MSQKTISVNPELFNLSSGGNTRKKKEKVSNEIKMKPKPLKRKDTLKKQSLLRMIRKHQQDKYRENVKGGNSSSEVPKDNFSFEQTKAFLSSLNTRNNTANFDNNKTLKTELPQVNSQVTINTLQQEIDEIQKEPQSVHMHVSTPNLNTQPKYGCLKHGNLPTYRMTMKNREFATQPQPSLQQSVNPSLQPSLQQSVNPSLQQQRLPNVSNVAAASPRLIDRQIMSMQSSNPNETNALNRFNEQYQARQRQKKIHRRTYNVGKSTSVPQVSVLVSNKKIRSNVTMKLQCIKQEPVDKIRKELIKRGLIRVGSLTPETLLRKMYETVELICGDVKNHNPDNLLYNYFHVEE